MSTKNQPETPPAEAEADASYLTPPQAAELAKVSAFTVRQWIVSGELPASRIGPRMTRIPSDAFFAFLKAREAKYAAALAARTKKMQAEAAARAKKTAARAAKREAAAAARELKDLK